MRRLLGATVGSVISVFAAQHAFAVDVAYSGGVMTFNDSVRYTVGTNGDFANCEDAVNAIPKNGPGGIIEFLLGNHTTSCGNLGFRGDILVTGQIGPNGERPRITTEIHEWSPGQFTKRPFITFQSDGPDNLVVENLDIYDSGKAINVWNYGGMVMRNVKIDNTNGHDAVKVYPEGNWWLPGGQQWSSWLEIYDSEVSRGGAQNIAHNFYIGRLDRVLVDNLYTHSSRGSHAFKSIARDLTITNSTFKTTELSYEDALTDRYLGTTLLDISACSKSRIENNEFVGLKLQPYERPIIPSLLGVGTTTASFMDFKMRRTKVGGCDAPRYDEADEFDWEAAAANGYKPENTSLLNHVVTGNTFINMGEHVGDNEIYLARNVGTTYVEDNGQSYHIGAALPPPAGWFERAIVWLDNNTKQGDIIDGNGWESTQPGEEGYTAPVYDLDEFDIVGIDETSTATFATNFTLTLYQTIAEPKSLLSTGLGAASLLVVFVMRGRRRSRRLH